MSRLKAGRYQRERRPLGAFRVVLMMSQYTAPLVAVTLQHQAGVGTAETEAVGEHTVNGGVVTPLGHDIEAGSLVVELLDVG